MILFAATDWEFFFFLLFAMIACVFALGVLLSSNVVRMAFYLVLSLGSTAGLFFLAGAEFVGAMQLMIYVGGTLVLLIFGVMLTAQSRFIEMKTRGSDWVLAIGVGGALFLCLANAAFSVPSWQTANEDAVNLSVDDSKTSAQLGAALVGVRTDRLEYADDPRVGGFSGYLLPFVIVSVHLLVVLIGAGYMARTKKVVEGGGAAAAEEEGEVVRRRRGVLFTAVSVIGMLANIKLAFLHWMAQTSWRETLEGWFDFFGLTNVYENNLSDFFTDYMDVWLQRSPNLMFLLGWLFIVNVALIFITLQWQRWSVYGLFVVPLVQVLVIWNSGVTGSVQGVMGALMIPGFLGLTLTPALVYLAILRAGGSRSIWSRLE